MPLTNNLDSSRDLIIFMISFTSEHLLWIAASVADADVVNPNGIKTLLANSLSTFPFKGNPAFCNGPKGLLKNHKMLKLSYFM